ncbi:hypothetical protein FOL47_002680 [Perkinsus chesapeaki]|uniref:Uncharacterized protein n=1 Tax=Perkinsus chesapeaki TaxID=330153 RepID=A0A7J6MC40_PERCH|nr:hypothetical protein FOL47_002680 [Perkinsus chesapeaki]
MSRVGSDEGWQQALLIPLTLTFMATFNDMFDVGYKRVDDDDDDNHDYNLSHVILLKEDMLYPHTPLLVLLTTPSYFALDRDLINLAFTGFKAKHGKKYADLAEEQKRADAFAANLAYIEEVNSKDLPYKLGVNEYTDLTFEEFAAQMLHPTSANTTSRRLHTEGCNHSSSTVKGLLPGLYQLKKRSIRSLQTSVDWRTKGVLNPIKDQGRCGSCWAFSANGALEAQYAIATGKLISLSEQQLNDCSTSYGNNGCNGGLMHYAYEYIKYHGVNQESTYPYRAQDLQCNSGKESNSDGLSAGAVTEYEILSSTDSALMGAISDAPVSIAVYANQAFQLYSSGVFTSNNCGGSNVNNINHAIVAVGYGSTGSEDTPTEKDLEHVHNYNTRLKSNTPAQRRAFNRKDKPKPKVKRQRSVLMPRKNSRPPSKAEQCLRLQKKQVREQGFETLWETLKASNPLESMSLIMKKRLAVHITLTQLYGYSGWACRKDLEEFVADMLEVSPPSVAKWCPEFELNLSLEEHRRGKHPKVRSAIFDTEFQPFRDRLRDQVREKSIGKDGNPNMTVAALTAWSVLSRGGSIGLGNLFAKAINVKPGGKQPKMRPGWFMKDGKRVEQEMIFPATHPCYPNEPKGLRKVVMERFGAAATASKKQDALVEMLSECDDFASQQTLLQEQALERGDRVIYGVKFHPELAPIEAAYRSITKAMRVSNSAKSTAGFKERVEGNQQPPDLTLELIRKHFRSAREYLRYYAEGFTMQEIEELRKSRRKHRGSAPVLGIGQGAAKGGTYDRHRLN